MQLITKDANETIKFGRRIARFFKKGDIIALFGNLGAGKTTLVKGIAKGLRVRGNRVNSPSFVLLKTYKGKFPLFHFDFYRIKKAQESYGIGLDDFLFSDGICVIEWADRIKKLLPKKHLRIELKFKNRSERKIKLIGMGKYYKDLVKKI